jgi:hypothetical protein
VIDDAGGRPHGGAGHRPWRWYRCNARCGTGPGPTSLAAAAEEVS